MIAGEGVITAPAGMRVAGDEIENVVISPDRGEWLGNVEVAEADAVVSGNIELQVIAGGKDKLPIDIDGLKHQLLDKGCDAAVTHHFKLAGFLCAGAGAAGT